ncbi:hypothetical protein [Nonlabens ponticola]|uniref:DUF4890 domain-containing protein n=1 Tax=Nonlabens ponticola TaxID=2496866 RepID=A0A3S9MXF9_9FLAO|nr:hypothetical protein [Nonlabens ponticola]AZQ43824.1 hypothetical protein EJ995_06120 [Nonlabens ponticola]
MKNFLLPLVMIFAMIGANAQRNPRMLAKNANPEQTATIQAQKMTLALDLSDKQQNQVKQLILEKQMDRQENKMTREERQKLTAEQKLELQEERLAKQIEMKRAMKDILNEEQYEKFEKQMARKKMQARKRMSDRREDRPRRGK